MIDRPERFSSSQVGGVSGLTPARYQSARPTSWVRSAAAATNSPAPSSTRPPFAARATEEMVELARLGHEYRQTPRHGASACGGCPQTGRHPAPHVGRRSRVPLWKGVTRYRSIGERNTTKLALERAMLGSFRRDDKPAEPRFATS